ncbi:unnamed protein product, partial [Closterium sp. NIES-53]
MKELVRSVKLHFPLPSPPSYSRSLRKIPAFFFDPPNSSAAAFPFARPAPPPPPEGPSPPSCPCMPAGARNAETRKASGSSEQAKAQSRRLCTGKLWTNVAESAQQQEMIGRAEGTRPEEAFKGNS